MAGAHDHEIEWLDAHEKRAWMAMLEVGSGLFAALNAHLRRSSHVTLEDYEALHFLSQEADRTLRIGVLSGKMLASRTRLSQRIDRLEARGLVLRSPSPQDGRAVNVTLTQQGLDVLEAAAPLHLEEVRRLVFDHLTDADIRSIGQSLEKVAEALRSERTPANVR